MRQHFLGSDALKLIYDVITWFSTQIAICYTVVPFVLLAVGPSLKFYRSVMHLHHYVSTPGQVMMSPTPAVKDSPRLTDKQYATGSSCLFMSDKSLIKQRNALESRSGSHCKPNCTTEPLMRVISGRREADG